MHNNGENKMETDIALREVMVREVVTGDMELNVMDAVKMMRKCDVDSIVVFNNGGPEGIVTEGDIICELVNKDIKPSTVKLKDIMTTPLVTASPNDRLLDIAKKMAAERIRKMPVIDGDELVGIVADVDLISVSSEMNTALAELIEMNSVLTGLIEMNVERETCELVNEDEGIEESICEKCGSFAHYMEMEAGLLIREGCKYEIEFGVD